MKLSIMTIGTRGDVQPYIAVGAGLKRAGHDVRIVTHDLFRGMADEHGLDFAPLAGNPEEMLQSEIGQKMMSASKLDLADVKAYVKKTEAMAVPTAENALAGCRDADAILCASSAYLWGEALEQALKAPVIHLSIYPMAPSRELPGPMASPWPGWLKPLSGLGGHWWHQKLMLDLQAFIFRRQTNRFRQEVFHLKPRGRTWGMRTFGPRGNVWIYGYSPLVVPRPRDWCERQHVVGWWHQDAQADWTPPESLASFLDRGPPPIYFGFGSMSSPHRGRITQAIVEALQRTGQRGVLAKGWGGIDAEALPDSCYLLQSAPHDWLFPRMAAVVHHGGAGTTGSGVRAGVPAIIAPFAFDQPFWGRALNAVGVAPPPIPSRALNADNLTEAIRSVMNNPAMQRQAAELGAKVRQETGVQNTVEIVERELARLSASQPSTSAAAVPATVS